MKKSVSLLLCMVLVFSLFPAAVTNAATTYKEGIYTYTVENEEATITDCNGSASGAITIPSELGGYPVTSIGDGAFSWCNSLTSITIPNSVTRIGYEAFSSCSDLTSITVEKNNPNYCSVDGNLFNKNKTTLIQYASGKTDSSYTIPNGVTNIGGDAFHGCYRLTSITIPDSVTRIGSGAFYGCSGLTSITIPDSVTSIGDGAFEGCKSLTSITIPDSVASIGDDAFHGCRSLTSITIPDSVTSIGYSAFYDCSGLTSITIPNSVTSIGDKAFYCCYGLTSITIPNSVTSIGDRAFEGCTDLTSITIPDSVTSIAMGAFSYCYGLTSITIPNSVTSLGDDAFFDCTGLTSITIPDSVTSIGNGAFSDCTGLTSITIPNSVTRIGDWAFYGCTGLTSITIPNSVTSLEESAFSGCTGLTSITIPNSVTRIGDWAFYGCTGLTSITIPDSVTSIGDWAFYGCTGLTSITIPDSVTSIGNGAFEGCTGLTSITIPDRVTSIGGDAFEGCTGLTSITIPDSVTSIGDRAFEGCTDLTSITIPDSVTSIGYEAFYGCSSLTSITIPNSVTSIASDAFRGCRSLTSIIIPDSVKIIYESAFESCDSLTDVAISKNIVTISSHAFDDCFNLNDVYYSGSEEEWNKINISSYGNEKLANAAIHYNSRMPGGSSSTSTNAPVITSATLTCGTSVYNLFSRAINIEKDSNVEVKIKVDVERNGCEDIKLYLAQNAKKDYKEFPLNATRYFYPGQEFDEGSDIYVIAVDTKTGKSTAKKTTLKITSPASGELFPGEGGSDALQFKLGNMVGFTVPDGVPVFGGTEIAWEFDFIPVSIEYDRADPNKRNIVFGTNIVTENKDGKTYFKDFKFDDYVTSFKKAASKQNRTFKQLRNDFKLSNANKMSLFDGNLLAGGKGGSSGEIDVLGYAEVYYSDGEWKFSEGQLAIKGTAKYEYQGQVFIWVVPLYYELGGKVGAALEGKMININPQNFTPVFSGYVSAEAGGKIGGGLGIAKVATLGAGGQATINIKAALDREYKKAWAEGEANFEVKVFGKKAAEKKIAQGDFLIYETGSSKGLIQDDAVSLQTIEQENLMSSIDSDKVYENESRDYLEEPTLWLTTYPIQGYGAAEYTNKNLIKIADNIYTEAAPQICEIEGKKVMVLQWDNPKREDIDRTMLVYSVYNDSTKQWSEAKAVDDDGTADFYPCFRDGYLVWQNETSKLSDNMTLEEIGKLGEICAAKWNGNGFDAPVTLTDNKMLDTQPVVCATKTGASAVWSVNSESDIMGVTGQNTLMQADFNGSAWTAPKAIKSDLTAVTNLNAGVLDGQFTVAYVTDDDNDLGTVDDRDIRIISGSSEGQLTDNDVLDSNPVFENNLIYYYSEGNVQYVSSVGGEVNSVFEEVKIGLHDRFVMDSNEKGDTAIWWEKTTETGTEIYACLLQDGVWSDEIQVTEVGQQAKYPSGLLNQNGSMDVVFNSGVVTDGEITKTDLYMISVIPSYDLALSDVSIDEETMTVYGTVKNNGELAVEAYVLEIEGNAEKTMAEALLPGQSAEFTIAYEKPSNFTPQDIKVTVSQASGEEYDMENNVVSLSVGHADVAVENVLAEEAVITADISNKGYQTASDVTVRLTDGKKVLGEKVLNLTSGQTEQVSFSVERKDMLFVESTKQLYVTAECKQTEISLGNNDGYTYITSVSGESDFYSKILNHSQVDGKWVINSVAGNNTDEDVTCTIYSSVYDKDGNLKGTGMKQTVLEAKNDTGVDITLSCTVESGDVVKTFLWKDMMPLTVGDSLTIE